MQPVGLLGEVRITALVLGVMAAPARPGAIWKWLSSVGRDTGTPSRSCTSDSYRPKAGVGMMTSSPGFRMVEKAAEQRLRGAHGDDDLAGGVVEAVGPGLEAGRASRR